jgi:3-methylcrotonyl-CoA carboxylase alpha subunit
MIVPIGDACLVLRDGRQTEVRLVGLAASDQAGGGDGTVKAPMHGKLAALFVAPGDKVAKGARLAIVEAMKMEHPLVAPFDATVEKVGAEVGAQVAQGLAIITLRAE